MMTSKRQKENRLSKVTTEKVIWLQSVKTEILLHYKTTMGGCENAYSIHSALFYQSCFVSLKMWRITAGRKKRSQSKEKINVSKCTIEGLLVETIETWKERQRR